MRNLTGKNTLINGDSDESIITKSGRAQPSIHGGGVNDRRLLTGP